MVRLPFGLAGCRHLPVRAQRPKPPGLFDTVPISRCPHEPLVPATRSTEPKVRRQRELMLRDLAVRIARKHLNYCIGREIKEPSPDELAQINAKIQAVLPERALTAAETKCWCYHERPLIGDTHKFYTDALAAYQRNSNDVIHLLMPEHGRFANLAPERMAQIRLLSRAVRMGPFEERDGELQELVDLPSLKPIWPTDVESSESITVTKGDKSIKLSPLASNIYQANFTQLKAVCKLLSKQSEVGRRIKQPLSAPNGAVRPPIEEPKRKKLKEDHMPFASPPLSSQPLRDGAAVDSTVRAKVAAALRVLSTDDLHRVAKAIGCRLFSASREEVERAAYESFFDGVPLQSILQVPIEHLVPQGHHAAPAWPPPGASMPPAVANMAPAAPGEPGVLTQPETPTGAAMNAYGIVSAVPMPHAHQHPQTVQPPPPPPQ
eukprot:Tamp_07290.p1 GENE.Tamp_07290~~Tamp_07290.p1  ORF type:complete len:434 (+),score=97.41 Tamp_07290:308-1609(+)